jgi:hypothetical protein
VVHVTGRELELDEVSPAFNSGCIRTDADARVRACLPRERW